MKADKKPLEFNNHFGAVSAVTSECSRSCFPSSSTDGLIIISTTCRTTCLYDTGQHHDDLGRRPPKHKEIALKLIEKAHTDRIYYNLLLYGVEGENYNLEGITSATRASSRKTKSRAGRDYMTAV